MTKRIRRRMKKTKQQQTRDSELVHVVMSLDGTPAELDDDCPLCRMLRETGEPVFTLDPFGNLAPFGR